MIMNRHLRENILIILTFLIAMALMILPLPHWALYARPQWVLVVLIFWLIYAPRKIGPFIAWCIGLYVDLLMGDLLGEHALIFVLFSYVVQRYLRVIQAMPVWQQTLAVGVGTFLCVMLETIAFEINAYAYFRLVYVVACYCEYGCVALVVFSVSRCQANA